MLKHLALSFLVLTMTVSCSPKRVLTPPTLALPKPPARAVEPCPALPQLKPKKADVVVWIKEVGKMYVDCDAKRALLVNAWPE